MLQTIFICLFAFFESVMVVGHRGNGCSQYQCTNPYPENSILSYLAGFANGADAIELDVWLSADDEIVVSHRDHNLPEDNLYASLVPMTSDPTPLVKDYYVANASKYALKQAWIHDQVDNATYHSDNYSVPASPPMRLPLFSEVLNTLCPIGRKIVCELKGNDPRLAPRVVQMLEQKDMFSCIHVMSTFQWQKYQNPAYETVADLLEPIRNESRVQRALLFNVLPTTDEEMMKAAEYYNAVAFHPSCVLFDVNADWGLPFVNLAHKNNRVVSCYYGSDIDKEDLLRDKLRYGLDEICTNNPDILSYILRNDRRSKKHQKGDNKPSQFTELL